MDWAIGRCEPLTAGKSDERITIFRRVIREIRRFEFSPARAASLLGAMNQEWFDVVDESDAVVGCELRADVHQRGLRHRAVHVLVFDRHGRLFLQKRSQNKDTWPGAWDSSCSGHVDSGEDYDDAARRELREELGIEFSEKFERLFKHVACAETGNEFVWVYRVRCDGPFRLNLDEIEGGDWFEPAAIDTLIAAVPGSVSQSFRHTWARFCRRGLAGG